MITREKLRSWCQPVNEGAPYLRPFVCRGPLQRGGALVVGINPATQIGSRHSVSFDEYVDSLTDLNRFLAIYDKVRKLDGKCERSATRLGLDEASLWLSNQGFGTVLDTNISPYPTESVKVWKKLSKKEQATWVFPEVVSHFSPSFVLLHGENSYEKFTSCFAPKLKRPDKFNILVAEPRLGIVHWSHGGTAEVYVCKHLRFFKGNEGGKYFAPLRVALAARRQN